MAVRDQRPDGTITVSCCSHTHTSLISSHCYAGTHAHLPVQTDTQRDGRWLSDQTEVGNISLSYLPAKSLHSRDRVSHSPSPSALHFFFLLVPWEIRLWQKLRNQWIVQKEAVERYTSRDYCKNKSHLCQIHSHKQHLHERCVIYVIKETIFLQLFIHREPAEPHITGWIIEHVWIDSNLFLSRMVPGRISFLHMKAKHRCCWMLC